MELNWGSCPFRKGGRQGAFSRIPLCAFIDGSEIVENHYYDIGIAVSTEKGLIVPVVRDCDELNLAAIEEWAYADKARSEKSPWRTCKAGSSP